MKNFVLGMMVMLVVGGLAAGAYMLGKQGRQNTQTEVVVVPTGVVPTVVVPTVDEDAVLISAVKQALVAKHGSEANSLNVSISKKEGDYAKGMASQQGGGGLWFAAKVAGEWKLVSDGNGMIMCADLTAYPDFPKSLIPECYDKTSGKTMTR